MHRNNWPEVRYVDSCLDYRSFAVSLDPAMAAGMYSTLREKLLLLGTAEAERMGVTYVRGPWGFLVIPQRGFHELRVSFYYDVPTQDSDAILASITAAVMASHTASALTGETNE